MSIGGFNKHKRGFNQQKCGFINSTSNKRELNNKKNGFCRGSTMSKLVVDQQHDPKISPFLLHPMGLNDDWLFELDLGFWERSNQKINSWMRILSEASLAWTRHRRLETVREKVRAWWHKNIEDPSMDGKLCFVHCTTGFLWAKFEPISQFQPEVVLPCSTTIGFVRHLFRITNWQGQIIRPYQIPILRVRTGFGQMAICVCQKLMFCK